MSNSSAIKDALNVNTIPLSLPTKMIEKYQIFEDLADGLAIINPEKSILYVNKSLERIFLYKREELIGCNVKVLMSEPHRSKHDSYVPSDNFNSIC